MEHVGERSEPHDDGEPRSPNVVDGDDGEPPDRGLDTSMPLVAIAVVALVVVVGLIGWLIGRGDAPSDVETAPGVITDPSVTTSALPGTSAVTTAPSIGSPTSGPAVSPTLTAAPATVATTIPATDPPTTDAPGSVAPPAIVPVSPAPATSPASLPPLGSTPATVAPSSVPGGQPQPGDDPIDAPTDIVPNLAAFPQYITDQAEREAIVTELLTTPRHDVSSTAPVLTLCAAVRLDASLRLSGRWELDGRPLSSLPLSDLPPPGFADCISEDGDPMADGAYQFVAMDAEGEESAAGTFVAGAARVDQRFRNNGDVAVCAILLSPATADYYEVFRLDVSQGDEVTIPIADVRQDVRTLGCTNDDELAGFSFDPSPAQPQDLVP